MGPQMFLPPTTQMHQTFSHVWTKPSYITTTQYKPTPDTMPALDATDCQCIQEVIGILLNYAYTIDPMLLAALWTLATQQAQGMQATMEALAQLLN